MIFEKKMPKKVDFNDLPFGAPFFFEGHLYMVIEDFYWEDDGHEVHTNAVNLASGELVDIGPDEEVGIASVKIVET